MITEPRDIAKLLDLNVDLGYLLQNPDVNTPQRVFDAIGERLHKMKYCLVHKEDLREAQETPEPAANSGKDLSLTLVPIKDDQS